MATKKKKLMTFKFKSALARQFFYSVCGESEHDYMLLRGVAVTLLINAGILIVGLMLVR